MTKACKSLWNYYFYYFRNYFLLLKYAFQVAIGKLAVETSFLVAVLLFQLYECLTVGGAFSVYSHLFPAAYDAIVLGRQQVQVVFGLAA